MTSIVCPVCYEDAKPGIDDLQAVAGCGHVFHELCLQQWLEYCVRKPCCPVCKEPCPAKQVHRLYFLSSDQHQQTQSVLHSQGSSAHKNEAILGKLESQLSVANLALQTIKQENKDLDGELGNLKIKLEKSECARRIAIGDRDKYRESSSRLQEEVNRYLEDRSRLIEKNTSLAKELASIKMVADVNLDEDEILRLANVGQGNNKDDIINTLTRSLVLRNKSYRDLVNKYSSLGMNEEAALQLANKASEKLRILKIRVQELEKALEVKENKELRDLKKKIEQSSTNVVAEKRMASTAVEHEEKGRHESFQDVGCSLPKPSNLCSAKALQMAIRREAPICASILPGDLMKNQEQVCAQDSSTRKRVYATTSGASASRGFTSSSSDKGSFILRGADGRGGRVTILKPPTHPGFKASAQKQFKRAKNHSSSDGLHIEHFFGRAE